MNTDTSSQSQQTGNRLQEFQQRFSEKCKDLSAQTDHYVHENAWKTLGIAVALGFLAGFLLGNRD